MTTPRFTALPLICWVVATLFAASAVLMQSVLCYADPLETGSSSTTLDRASGTAGQSHAVHPTLAGRHRIEFRMGYWDRGRSPDPLITVHGDELTRVENLVGAVSYSYWGYDRLAADITIRGLVAEVISVEDIAESYDSAVIITSAMFGVRFYPVSSAQMPLRPYATAAIGPYLGIESYEEIDADGNSTVQTTRTLGSYGAYLGGGLDIQFGRHLMFGVQAGYNAMTDFAEPLKYEDNYSAFEVSAGFSVIFG